MYFPYLIIYHKWMISWCYEFGSGLKRLSLGTRRRKSNRSARCLTKIHCVKMSSRLHEQEKNGFIWCLQWIRHPRCALCVWPSPRWFMYTGEAGFSVYTEVNGIFTPQYWKITLQVVVAFHVRARARAHVCVYMYICMCVCMYVCTTYVCMYICMHGCISTYRQVHV